VKLAAAHNSGKTSRFCRRPILHPYLASTSARLGFGALRAKARPLRNAAVRSFTGATTLRRGWRQAFDKMTRALPFTEHSLRRAIVGARKAGLRVTGIRPDGTLVVQESADPVAEWVPPLQPDTSSRWGDVEA
jgi:hypothetical protein